MADRDRRVVDEDGMASGLGEDRAADQRGRRDRPGLRRHRLAVQRQGLGEALLPLDEQSVRGAARPSRAQKQMGDLAPKVRRQR